MIIKAVKTTNYTTICNEALNDSNLSLKAKGLWAFLMTKPGEWSINYRGLKTQLKEGQSAILAALKELEEAGYLVRGRVQAQENGKFTQAPAKLYEKPCVENPRTDNPRTENLRTKVITEQVRTDKDIDDKSSMGAKAPSGYGKEELNSFFDLWASKVGIPIQRQIKRNRFACYSLLQAMGQAGLRDLIETVVKTKSDKYAPVITDFVSLEFKLSQLQAWEVRSRPAAPINVGAILHPEKYGSKV